MITAVEGSIVRSSVFPSPYRLAPVNARPFTFCERAHKSRHAGCRSDRVQLRLCVSGSGVCEIEDTRRTEREPDIIHIKSECADHRRGPAGRINPDQTILIVVDSVELVSQRVKRESLNINIGQSETADIRNHTGGDVHTDEPVIVDISIIDR